jgi:hypothetical protein
MIKSVFSLCAALFECNLYPLCYISVVRSEIAYAVSLYKNRAFSFTFDCKKYVSQHVFEAFYHKSFMSGIYMSDYVYIM